jgi:hypothetical protein
MTAGVASADEGVSSSPAERNDQGFLLHRVESALQSGPTSIRVLLPDQIESGRRYPVLYVLPVEAGDGNRYGDGLLECKNHDLHNKHNVICVAPTFSDLPWYADHPSDNTDPDGDSDGTSIEVFQASTAGASTAAVDEFLSATSEPLSPTATTSPTQAPVAVDTLLTAQHTAPATPQTIDEPVSSASSVDEAFVDIDMDPLDDELLEDLALSVL